MKLKKLISAVLTVIACTPLIPTISHAQTDPVFPTGSLSATPKTVYPGVYPVLTWDITYPEVVTDVIDIEVPGVITPKEDLYMDIRVLGASVGTASGIWATVQGWVRADGSYYWQNFFSGKQPDVDPTRIYLTKLVRQGQPNHFGGTALLVRLAILLQYYHDLHPEYHGSGQRKHSPHLRRRIRPAECRSISTALC